MNWLARLKNAPSAETDATKATKPLHAQAATGFVGFVAPTLTALEKIESSVVAVNDPLATATDNPDRWCWPASDALNMVEIDTFRARLSRFTDKGMAVLYGPGKYFACRRCCGLGYASQREGVGDRSSRQADKLRKRLGWEAGILNGDGGKPKGLHWATYQRLKAEHDRLVQISFQDIGRKFGFLHKYLAS